MNRNLNAPVVVGMDGSPEAQRAARYAAREADQRRAPLRLVCAHPGAMRGSVPMITSTFGREDDIAHELLATTQKTMSAAYPDVTVQSAVITGSAAGVLVDESRHAALVVIGTRATGGLLGHLAGSIAAQVAAHAHSPVIVLRPTAYPDDAAVFDDRPVVVGIDGSAESEKAMRFAVDEAVARHTDLRAVYVWTVLGVHDIGALVADTYVNSEEAAKAARLLTEATSGWSDRYPDLTITHHPLHDTDTLGALVRAGDGAGLIVVGSRGNGGFLGLRLGSTVDGLIRFATASIAVVRGDYPDKR